MRQEDRQISPTARWAQFAADLRYDALPAELLPILKGLLLDTIGVALAASTLGDCCGALAKLVESNPGTPECTVLGFGLRAGALPAALANGALAHALNFDALGGSGGHIGLASVPAPLLLAERRGGVSGKELLVAVALAAEFTARLAAALHEAGSKGETALEGQVLGYFGAALGAGRILRLTPERLHSALGLALMQAAGTRQVSLEGGAGKAIYGGFSNHGAVLAALLAEQGIDARCAALEGPAGLYGLFYGGRYETARLDSGLGAVFHSFDIGFKRWATSSVLHPFIAACLQLRATHRIDPTAIRRIRLRVAPGSVAWLEPAAERRRPKNAAAAANSLFFGIAKALANGAVALADFTVEGLAQPAALSLAERIDYEVEEIITGPPMMIEMADGRNLSASPDAAAEAVTFDQLTAKFRDCARYAAHPPAPSAIEEFIERVGNLEREADAAVLPALLTRGGKL